MPNPCVGNGDAPGCSEALILLLPAKTKQRLEKTAKLPCSLCYCSWRMHQDSCVYHFGEAQGQREAQL